MASNMVITEIFRCSKRAEMYLYVDKATGLDGLPDDLLASLGDLSHVMVLKLNEDRHLARADVERVMAAIREQGFYLQMPPADPVTGIQVAPDA